MTNSLTTFQQTAQSAIRDLFRQVGRAPESEVIAGDKERYVVISFNGYRVLLYLDGAEVLGRELDRRFEKEDFDSLDDLQADLLSELRRLLA